jgi:uncharacterized protein (TIGR03790 family)
MKFCWVVLTAFCLGCSPGWSIDPKNVVILVNQSEDESIDLGYYYALKREVPIENIVHLALSSEEQISWELYLDNIYNPLMSWLFAAGWMDGFSSERLDASGRQVSLVNGHKIEALVVCKGVPLRIQNDPSRLPPRDGYPENKLMLLTNRASVDSELATLPFPKASTDSFVSNPLFQRTSPQRLFDVKPLVVGRLDGPTYELARGLINSALTAEEKGISGRAYIDIGGPHEGGDTWLEQLAPQFEAEGFEVDLQSDKNRFNLVDRFDAPLFYFGWYAGSVEGPFTHYGFKFPPGAFALHIHSFSASSVRSGHEHWLGPLVARGVTGALGNTSEPYLFYTHQPHLFMEAIFKGLSAGQAALYSIPALSWQGVYLGDPLYQPPVHIAYSPDTVYGVLRVANRARRAGDPSAYKAVVAEHDRTRHFACGLWLYHYFLEAKEPDKAYEYLASSYQPTPNETWNWGVLVNFAEGFLQTGHHAEAVTILNDLIDRSDGKREIRTQLLKRYLQLAETFELKDQRPVWKEQLDKLTAPVQESKKPQKN